MIFIQVSLAESTDFNVGSEQTVLETMNTCCDSYNPFLFYNTSSLMFYHIDIGYLSAVEFN